MKIAYYLPERTLDNKDLVRMYPEWTEAKVYTKTGISSRHVVGSGETALDLA